LCAFSWRSDEFDVALTFEERVMDQLVAGEQDVPFWQFR